MTCYELKVIYHDGTGREYLYDTLSSALEHVVQIAERKEARTLEVWEVHNIRVFAYTNG